MDQKTSFTVMTGRDDNGLTVPYLVVYIGEDEYVIQLTKEAAKELGLSLIEAEAQCRGRNVVRVERKDGELNS